MEKIQQKSKVNIENITTDITVVQVNFCKIFQQAVTIIYTAEYSQ